MTPPDSSPTRTALRISILSALFALAALVGCGPGTGGTGLPPGGSSAQPDAAATVSAPTVQAPTADTVPLLRPPSTSADLEGPITAVDSATVTVSGTALPRALLDAVGSDGRAAPTDALAVGIPVRAWRIGERWLLVVPSP
jgi:predicted small lipoprotein YifL